MDENWERVIDLSRYYPEFLKNNRELKQITGTEGEELRRLYEETDRVWKDGFIRETTLQGIRRWESLLGLKPYPGDTLQERRAAVAMKWNQQLPYTLARLHERLTAVVGEKGYELYLRHLIYQLEIDVIDQPYRVLQSLREMTGLMIPANLDLIFAGKYPVELPHNLRLEAELLMEAEFFARYNLEFLRLDNTWKLDDTYRLSGYKEREKMEFYPVVLTLPIEAREDVQLEAGLTVEHDKWLLDNSYQLNNTKKLDAYFVQVEL